MRTKVLYVIVIFTEIKSTVDILKRFPDVLSVIGPKLVEEAFEELITHTIDMLTVLDGEGVIQYESPSVERVIGYKPGELDDEDVFQYIHPDDRQKAIDTFYEVIEADIGYTTAGVGLRFRHKDGSRDTQPNCQSLWLTANAAVAKDTNCARSSPVVISLRKRCRK